MEIFRHSRDAWGQETLQGVAFELFWVFLGLGVVLILGHWFYYRFTRKQES